MTEKTDLLALAERRPLIEAEAKRRCVEAGYSLDYMACQDKRFRHDDRRPWWEARFFHQIENEIVQIEKAGFVVRLAAAPCPGRDEIARIIDPTAWKMEDGYWVEQEHSDDALAKADAILAASRAPAMPSARECVNMSGTDLLPLDEVRVHWRSLIQAPKEPK